MTVTRIDIDDAALAEVMRLAGTRTTTEAVNLALRKYAERHGRLEAFKQFRDEAKGWDYHAWRRLRGADKGTAG